MKISITGGIFIAYEEALDEPSTKASLLFSKKVRQKLIGGCTMKKWISMGVLTAFLFSCVSCDMQGDKKDRRSRRGHRSVAQVEQIVDADVQ